LKYVCVLRHEQYHMQAYCVVAVGLKQATFMECCQVRSV
jgi:hypothetical protein